jgi:hypothetical protein
MAWTEGANIQSFTAGATFSTADLYKFVVVASSQDRTVVLPNTTGNILPVGTLYGRTSTTSAAGSQAVPVAVSGAVKVNMAASTLAAGQFVASSTAGLGIAPTTDAYTIGPIVAGSSGAAGRINTVQWTGVGPLSAP